MYKIKTTVYATDTKKKFSDTDKIENFILAYKSARNDNSRSEEILLKVISEFEQEKKNLQFELQTSSAQHKIIEL